MRNAFVVFIFTSLVHAIVVSAQSPLTMDSPAPGQFGLNYASSLNHPWRLMASDDLTLWRYDPAVTVGNGGVQSVIKSAAGVERRFWRVTDFPPDAGYKMTAGPYTVAPFADESWVDTARGYTMPVRIYAPAIGQGGAPFPIVVLSHGLSGSIGAFDTLSAYLASHGYICLMIEHDDTRTLSRVARPLDVTFAIDVLLASPTHPLLAGRVDGARIAHSGHSFGAFTTLAVLGAQYHITDNEASAIVSYPDARVKCGVPLSPQGATTLGLFSGSWDLITRPSLTMHGTLDTAPGTPVAITRRQPYDEMPAGNKAHLTLDEGIHSDFSDTGIADHGNYYSRWYFPAMLAFLDTHLSGNATAAAWLDALTLTRLSSGVVLLETK
ncbi:hypothetical protein [Prosthecobacter sp.]|uniref:alpha/beta hydrolase family protein n=1 Tax=Prosthecobacter sp. TaxID=1965333 RepID=UPI002ABAD6A3|nr:hypothetical protein [Prosthecobacter sp.]MDZ4405975.1 hypothetical protein [Prosthecobacter sp.]